MTTNDFKIEMADAMKRYESFIVALGRSPGLHADDVAKATIPDSSVEAALLEAGAPVEQAAPATN